MTRGIAAGATTLILIRLRLLSMRVESTVEDNRLKATCRVESETNGDITRNPSLFMRANSKLVKAVYEIMDRTKSYVGKQPECTLIPHLQLTRSF